MTNRHFHEGELALQNKMGMRKQIDRAAEVMMRDHMPEQHREFFNGLEYAFIGTVGEDGKPWASLVTGPSGFLASPDPKTLRVTRPLDRSDPAFAALDIGSPMGVLGLDFTNRRRNRMHGKIARIDAGGFDVAVAQSYGNCPKYISTRRIVERVGTPAATRPVARAELTSEDITLIKKADTFFIATHHLDGSGQPYEGADISHRGGHPGFVRVENANRLIIPDYQGNNLFNTLGNLLANPAADLLFIDFETGDLLHVNGDASIIEDASAIAPYPGAKRLLKIGVSGTYRVDAGSSLRWVLLEASPFSPPA
ncbi:MAG: pyridoxamine 5'-phosphate oxidase family protein [Pseudomonadota bacterium]